MEFPIPPLLYPNNLGSIGAKNYVEQQITPRNKPTRYTLPPSIIYHYTKFPTALQIIKGHKLKFSNPNSFNDIFDMHDGFIDFKASDQQKAEWAKETYINKARDDKRRLKKLVLKNDKGFLEGMRSGIIDARNSVGVCCFSKLNDNEVMWGHYAEKNTGICLGFDFQPIETRKECVLIIEEVVYKDEIKPISYFSEKDAAVKQWIFTKKIKWSYEYEVRAFINNKNCIYNWQGKDLFDFEKVCLKEIYFGTKVLRSDIEVILDLLETCGYNVKVKMKMAIEGDIIRPINL